RPAVPAFPLPPRPTCRLAATRVRPIENQAREMLRYIAYRLVLGLLMLLALTVLIFIMLRLTPGDPIDAYINPTIPIAAADLAALRDRLGLDQPLPVQYFAWLGAALSGDFGYSIQRSGAPVLPLV